MSGRKLGYGRAYLDRTTLADGGPLTFVASSAATNRYGFALNQDHWLLNNFKANPVILWAHDAGQPPIGTADASPQFDHLRAAVTFDLEDDFARKVDSKYRRGFLSAVSVGFDFAKADGTPIENPWRLSPERIHAECFYDLAEISAVPVPADPQALRQNHRRALSFLGHELVDLFDEQEDGQANADEIREAVRAELAALGVDLSTLTAPLAAEPEGEPNEPVTPPAPPAGIERDAAQAVLAAFNLGEEKDA